MSEPAILTEEQLRQLPYLTTQQVAALVHCSERTIDRLDSDTSRGRTFPRSRQVSARKKVYVKDEIVDWVDSL